MSAYLDAGTNFEGFALLAKPANHPECTEVCIRCKGHGGWNLKLDAYGPGEHFSATCCQCHGWGWVTPVDAEHVHVWEELDHAEAEQRAVYLRPQNGQATNHAFRCTVPGCTRTLVTDSSG